MTINAEALADARKLTPLMAQARIAELENYHAWAMESARWESMPNVAAISATLDEIEDELAALRERLAEINRPALPEPRGSRRSLRTSH